MRRYIYWYIFTFINGAGRTEKSRKMEKVLSESGKDYFHNQKNEKVVITDNGESYECEYIDINGVIIDRFIFVAKGNAIRWVNEKLHTEFKLHYA